MIRNKNKRVSLKSLTKRIGVSTALILIVLNKQEKEKMVGTEAVIKKSKALEEMKYNPNYVARRLSSGTMHTLGLIVADIANLFFCLVAKYIKDEASKSGYKIIIGSSDEKFEESEALVNIFLNRQIDEFIIIHENASYDNVKKLIEEKLLFVMVEKYITELSPCYVVLDNLMASYNATIQLLNKGYKHIVLSANESFFYSDSEKKELVVMRHRGQENNIWINYIRYDHLKSDINRAIEMIHNNIMKMIDDLIIATNSLSIARLYIIENLKIKVNENLALIGFDGNEDSDFLYSLLPYVNQPVDEMGKEAVIILIDQSNGSKKISYLHLLPQLMTRNSC